MHTEIITIVLVLIALAAGVFLGMLLRRKLSESTVNGARVEAQKIVSDAAKEAETITKEAIIQAKDLVLQAKTDWEKEARELRKEIHANENRLQQKEENLDRKFDQLEKKMRNWPARKASCASWSLSCRLRWMQLKNCARSSSSDLRLFLA